MVFYVMECNICGKWNVQEIRKQLNRAIFKCKYCGKNTKIHDKHKGEFKIKMYGEGFEHPYAARNVCQYLNANTKEQDYQQAW